MNSKTDYVFNIPDRHCVMRNVPCYEHHGAIAYNMDVVGILPTVKDVMLLKEIPDDIEYEEVLKILRTR